MLENSKLAEVIFEYLFIADNKNLLKYIEQFKKLDIEYALDNHNVIIEDITLEKVLFYLIIDNLPIKYVYLDDYIDDYLINIENDNCICNLFLYPEFIEDCAEFKLEYKLFNNITVNIKFYN